LSGSHLTARTYLTGRPLAGALTCRA